MSGFDEPGIRLPYGLTADGRLAHVSEVHSGLACDCRCPECHAPLVARKGTQIVHHFAHQTDRACPGAQETMLHLLAKEVVLHKREIRLPPVVAIVANLKKQISATTIFRYETAETEIKIGRFRPDAVVRRGNRKLMLEFAVTHPCEASKLLELQQLRIATVEIDLKHTPRIASRQEHETYILHTAPRRWIFNRLIADAEIQLGHIASRNEQRNRERKDRLYGGIANKIAAAWPLHPRPHDPGSLREMRDAGYGKFVSVAVPGEKCFAVHGAIWKAAFLRFSVMEMAGRTITAASALSRLQVARMLKEPFLIHERWEPELVAYLKERIGQFAAPNEVIGNYAFWLVERGVLVAANEGWRSRLDQGADARDRIAAAAAIRIRVAHVQSAARTLLEPVHSNPEATAARLRQPLSEFDASPREIARMGGERFNLLKARLAALERMARIGVQPAENTLLGLPLESFGHRAADEARARDKGR